MWLLGPHRGCRGLLQALEVLDGLLANSFLPQSLPSASSASTCPSELHLLLLPGFLPPSTAMPDPCFRSFPSRIPI